MASIVIKHCPICSNAGERADDLAAVLKSIFGLTVRVEEGAEGEFTIAVNGLPVIERSDAALPTVEEAEVAVRNAVPWSVRAG